VVGDPPGRFDGSFHVAADHRFLHARDTSEVLVHVRGDIHGRCRGFGRLGLFGRRLRCSTTAQNEDSGKEEEDDEDEDEDEWTKT
jgi:hypothetical protein